MIETDILVVGAGPSGSLAAKEAALKGANVLLIDRKSEIGSPKRCAEGVSKEGLKELGIKPDKRWIARELDGVRLVSPNNTSVWLDTSTIPIPEAGYILERKVFDKHMAMDAARDCAKIMIKTNATSLKRVDDGFILKAERMGKEIEIHANIIIAADGPESRIGRMAGLKCSTPAEHMESCVQFEMAGLEMENNRDIALFFGSAAPGGYVWIFPKGDDVANVGIGVLKSKTDKSALEHLVEFIENSPETKNAQAVEMNVGGDPVAGVMEDRTGDNILVVGDAAGFVNPLTGGGINSALESGVYAGIVAADAVERKDYSKASFDEYLKLTDENIAKNYRKYDAAKKYLLSLEDSELDEIAEAFANEEFTEVTPKSLLKKLVKISPKALLKLGKIF